MSWTLIEHQALTSSAASVTLGSGGTIPQTYKTLKLVISARQDAINSVILKPNNATSSLSARRLYGTGSSAASDTQTDLRFIQTTVSSDTTNTFGSCEITIPNYSGSTNKPFSSDAVSENNGTTAYQMLAAGLWSSSSAITSLVVATTAGNLVSGSTFTLYGLA